MKKYFFGLFVIIISVFACSDDDDGNDTMINPPTPPRDRAEQAATDDAILQDYLKTHFYKLTELDDSNSNFNNRVILRKITENDSLETSLWDDENLNIKKVVEEGVEQNLYVLNVQNGSGEQKATFADSTFVTYKGQLLDGESFDSSPNPIWFDLLRVIRGFREGLAGYSGASELGVGNDGTFRPGDDYGIGAVFIPSGLAYFDASQAQVGEEYANLVFTYEVLAVEESDHDRDNVPTVVEDLDSNSNVFDDDTDGNGTPNFLDNDDDGDGIATIDEDLEPDADPTVDRDGDGDPTNDIGDGDPTNDDTDGDGIPNYLDADSTQSRNQ